MEQAEPSKEKTELIKETKLLEDFPVEVLVRIFNFLPNYNIRCGVSMACKKFQKICQFDFLDLEGGEIEFMFTRNYGEE